MKTWSFPVSPPAPGESAVPPTLRSDPLSGRLVQHRWIFTKPPESEGLGALVLSQVSHVWFLHQTLQQSASLCSRERDHRHVYMKIHMCMHLSCTYTHGMCMFGQASFLRVLKYSFWFCFEIFQYILVFGVHNTLFTDRQYQTLLLLYQHRFLLYGFLPLWWMLKNNHKPSKIAWPHSKPVRAQSNTVWVS